MGERYTRFRDIPLLISYGSWQCDFPMERALMQIDQWQREEGLDIDPDFQRIHVWTEAQQVAWMEFILRGGKTGRVIYLNNASWNKAPSMDGYAGFVLVDGKQRLQAMRRFYANEIRVFGSFLSEYSDSPDMLRQDRIQINVNDLQCRADVLRWYLEFNSGGTPHTAEEIAKAAALLHAEQEQGK